MKTYLIEAAQHIEKLHLPLRLEVRVEGIEIRDNIRRLRHIVQWQLIEAAKINNIIEAIDRMMLPGYDKR